MNQTSIELLTELTQADAIPGHEAEVRQIFHSCLEGVGDIQKDRLGSIFCTKIGNAEKPRILLDSHMDEVGIYRSERDGSRIRQIFDGRWMVGAYTACTAGQYFDKTGQSFWRNWIYTSPSSKCRFA